MLLTINDLLEQVVEPIGGKRTDSWLESSLVLLSSRNLQLCNIEPGNHLWVNFGEELTRINPLLPGWGI